MNQLQEIDGQLLACDFNFTKLADIEQLLARRNELVRQLAGELRRSLDTGAELTDKLAAYRGRLNSELQRSQHVALHQYVVDDIPGDAG